MSVVTNTVAAISGNFPTTPGTYTLNLRATNSAGGTGTVSVTNFTVTAIPQAITFGTAPTITVGGAGTVSATGGGSGQPVVFTSTTPSICTVSGTNGSTVTVLGTAHTTDTCTIAANQAATPVTGQYSAAPQVTQNVPISIANQTISSFIAPVIPVGGSGTVSATGGASGNPVTFSSLTTGVCTVSGTNGSTVTVAGTAVIGDTCTIAANQAGVPTQYNPATQATLNVGVGLASQSISFGAPPALIVSGTGTLSATGGASGNPVVFTSQTSGICTVSGSTVTVTGTAINGDTCTITATQAGVPNQYSAAAPTNQNINVGPITQSISFGAAPGLSVGGSGAVSATGGASGNPVVFTSLTVGVCTVSGTNGSTVTVTGAALSGNTCTIAANQSGTNQYTAANQMTQNITIGITPQVITLGAAPPSIIVGATATLSATGGASGNPVVFTSLTTSVCAVSGTNGSTVTGVLAGTCSIAANQAGTANRYTAATQVTQNITVSNVPVAAGNVAMQVPLNTPTALDLSPYITGTAVSGISLTAPPKHGSVTVSGTSVTYTPVTDYFGTDAFSYAAFGASGTSPPGVVSVTVVGRPDPLQDKNVTGVIEAQLNSAKRFGRTQIANVQQHMESLHRRFGDSAAASPTLAQTGMRRSIADQQVIEPRVAPLINNDWKPIKAKGEPWPASALSLPNDQQGLGGFGNRITQQNGLSGFSPAGFPTGQPSGQDARQTLAQGLAALGLPGVSGTSVNLTALGASSSVGAPTPSGSGVWAAGNVQFGTNDDPSNPSHFSTDGISIGYDRNLSDNLVMGVAIGYAHDKTTLNNDGTKIKLDGTSGALYVSYQPSFDTFVDAVLGYGKINYESDRHITATGDTARGDRNGDLIFGSLAGGYEYRMDGLLFSPYGRLDMAYSNLNAVTETGAGLYNLRYGKQDGRTIQLSFGLRGEATHLTDFALVLPHARLELQHSWDRSGGSLIQYADQLTIAGYNISSSDNNRNSVVLGLGTDFIFNNGTMMSVDYQTLRSIGGEHSQGIGIRLNKEFDGPGLYGRRGASSSEVTIPTLGITVDAGYTYDDNVSRAVDGPDKYSDESFSANLRKNWTFEVSDNSRIVLNGFFSGEKFREFIGLNHLTLGSQAEYQYRASGDFLAPTLGAFVRLSAENYESTLRDGYRGSAGLSIRQPLTDRISLFGTLATNYRDGSDKVFDTQDYSARINLDYRLASKGSLYVSGEYRDGDIVSAGQGTLQNFATAKAWVRDDVFVAPQLFDYRFKGWTVLTTVGYALPLGPTDSLDLSWRRVESAPFSEPSFVTDHARYIVNQYSLKYLTRF